MTSRLALYNRALQLLGQRPLAALTDNNRARRELDTAWDNNAVQEVLEEGHWNYALRTVKLGASTSIEPDFGYTYAFAKPLDLVRLHAIAYDEFFHSPILQYANEAGYWFCNIDEIYVQYVSNDTAYGNSLGDMPESLQAYLCHLLAVRVGMPLTHDKALLEGLKRDLQRAKLNAMTQDASNQGVAFTPMGSWGRARLAGFGPRNREGRYRGA